MRAIGSAVHSERDRPSTAYAAPPRLGEHTHEVLTGLLGYTSEEVGALAQARVV